MGVGQNQRTMSSIAPVPVTFVSEQAQLGGAERYLEALIAELGDDWVDGVIALADGPFVERLDRLGIDVEVVPAERGLGLAAAALRLRRALRRRRPAVIHANGVKAASLCALAVRGLRTPIVWLKVDLARDGPIAWATAAGCTRIVGISTTTLETFPRSLRRRARVVYAAVPAIETNHEAARRLVLELTGFPAQAEVVVVSGRLSPGKGQIELIDAAPRVLAAREQARFAILGGEDSFFPGYEEELRNRVAAAGLAGSFAFVGHRPPGIESADDAARFVSGCEVLAAPSVRQARGGWREGFGLAPVEALAVGTPVVAYASGALPEVLDGCARIVPEGDRLALGDAIAGLLVEPELRRALIERGRRRARERFSIDRAAEQMSAQYAELARR